MRLTLAFLLMLATTVTSPLSSPAGTGDITAVIDRFVTNQFPTAASYFWVVNNTQWQTDNEVVVDVNAIVQKKAGEAPTSNRYLLLIVGDRLAASQNIPEDSNVECAPEQQA